MLNRVLNWTYIILQIVLILITLIFLRGVYDSLAAKLGIRIFIDVVLLIIQNILGLVCSIGYLRTGREKYLSWLVYAPMLLFIIGGIVRTIGIILMLLAMYLRFHHQSLNKKIVGN